MKPAIIGRAPGTKLQSGLCDVHRVLISRQRRGGKKKTPVGDGRPWPAFEYFSIYRASALSVGDAQKRHTRGGEWVEGGVGGVSGEFFISQKGGEEKKSSPAGVGLCRLSYECHYMWLSFCWVIIAFFSPVLVHFSWQQMDVKQVFRVQDACTERLQLAVHLCCTHTYLLSLQWRDVEEHWNLSEDSSALCSIIHHLWLQNSLGSLRGYARYPDGKSRRAAESLFTLRPALLHRSIQPVPSLPCSHQSHQK